MGMQLARVRASSTGWPGAPGLNTFYFSAGHDAQGEPGTAITSGDAQLCHTRVRSAFQAALQLYPSLWSGVVDPTVDVINATDGQLITQFTVTPSAGYTGAAGPAFGPTAVMMLVRLRTNAVQGGKKIQGRAFLGPVTPASKADGSPSVGHMQYVQDFINALNDSGIGGVPVLQVWRRPRKAIPTRVPPVTARDGFHGEVTSLTVPSKYAVLRSRRD